MTRSWTIAAMAATAGAAMLALGLFLAVGKDTLAGDPAKVSTTDDGQVKVVRVISGDEGNGFAFSTGDDDSFGTRKGGYLGVSVREDTKSNEGGAFVENVVDDSPAEKAGLKDGDVIVGFGGDVIRGPMKLTEKLRATKPGDKISMDVRRDGKSVKLQVEMGDRPKVQVWSWAGGDSGNVLSLEQQKALEESLKNLDDKMPELQKLGKLGNLKMYGPGGHRIFWSGDKPLLGVEMVEATPDLREALGGSKDAGVLVGKVLPGTAAEKAGIRAGDMITAIDGTKVADSGDIMEAIRAKEGKTVDIDLIRDKKSTRVKAGLPKLDEQEDPPTGPRASVWNLPVRLGGGFRALRAKRSV
jgi:predicted metalloprotease with PDZ domain